MKGLSKGIGFFLLYVVVTIVFQIALTIAFMGICAASGVRDEKVIQAFGNNNVLSITIISGILISVTFFLFFKWRKADIKKEWKLNKFSTNNFVLAILITFSYSLVYAMITYDTVFENSQIIHNSVDFYSDLYPGLGLVLMAVNLLVIAPVSEEVVLRGIVFTRVEKTTNAFWPVIVSSFLFGLMHLMAGGAVLVIGAVLMGLILGVIFAKTKSLWVCIIAHVAANLPDFILYNHPNLTQGFTATLEIVFGLIFVMCLFFMIRGKK